MTSKVAGTGPRERQLNGPQTSGREYQNLSQPEHVMVHEFNVRVPMRDGETLLADVYRPQEPGHYPVLVSASPYPRQIQDVGAPMGFIEAGASDYFVPRGYVHVIANLRGTGGSTGTFGFFDQQERHDMYDLVEWAAIQDWSDGNVGMLGISYFAMTQLEAAVENPPHLRAIMPIAVSPDLYEAASHHGLVSTGFLSPFLAMVGITSGASDRLWRSDLVAAARHLLNTPRLHKKFAHMNGEAAITVLKGLMRLPYETHPWDDLWRDTVVKHPLRDEWWDERNLLPLMHRVTVPTYLGCDWQNVPLHLPGTFTSLDALTACPEVRVAMLGDYGLTWPWESLHVEALAWYDHWLKGRDTGILEGPKVRYVLPGADGWRCSDQWPPPEVSILEWTLRTDGGLAPLVDGAADQAEGSGVDVGREFMVLGAGLNRTKASKSDPPTSLAWTSEPLNEALDLSGGVELELIASATAADTAWIATLFDVDQSGAAEPITAGYLRASLRAVDEEASQLGAPVLACRTAQAVPIGEALTYRIPLVSNARRFVAGNRIRIVLTSDDQPSETTAMMGFRHASVGTSSVNTVYPTSRLLLSVATAGD